MTHYTFHRRKRKDGSIMSLSLSLISKFGCVICGTSTIRVIVFFGIVENPTIVSIAVRTEAVSYRFD